MLSHLWRRVLAATALCVAASSCTDVDTDTTRYQIGEVHQAIANGQRDTLHSSVVGLFNRTQGGICSGTLIAPNLVLTAQHCVSELNSQFVLCGSTEFGDTYAPSSFMVTTDPVMSPFGQVYNVSEVLIPPGDRDLCNTDIALLVLQSNVPSSVTEPYIPRVDITAQQGEIYSAHGYGDTDGTDGQAGIRRWIDERQVFCDGDACRAFGGNQIQDREWIGSNGTCQGDSGGPALDVEGRVFGVLSRGGDGCSNSVYSAVDDWGEWIQEVAADAAERGEYAPAPWVITGNSDPNFVDDDLDGIANEEDNCVDVANIAQADMDRDGLGDVCDDTDDRDRGGACQVCNSCVTDDECPRGVCVDFGDGGRCSYDCQTDDDCPATTTCFGVPNGAGERKLCLNDNAAAAGVCEASYVCGGTVAENPDAFACDVCEGCSEDSQCNGGLCLDFGSGSVCTAACDAGSCPDGSECYEVSGQSVCLNPGAAETGVCPASYICGDASSNASSITATSSNKGCTSAPASLPALWMSLSALLVLRRRRSA